MLFWRFSNNFLSEFQFLCPPALNTSHVQTVRFIYKYKWGDMKHRGKAPLINSTSASACAAWTWLSVTARSCECVSAAVHHLPVSLMAEQGAAILPRHLYLTTPPLAHTLASSPDLTTVSAPLQHHCSDNYKPGVGSFGCIRVQKFSPRTHSCWREILHNSCAGSDKRFSWKGFVFSETRARCFTTTKWELRNILNICQFFLTEETLSVSVSSWWTGQTGQATQQLWLAPSLWAAAELQEQPSARQPQEVITLFVFSPDTQH